MLPNVPSEVHFLWYRQRYWITKLATSASVGSWSSRLKRAMIVEDLSATNLSGCIMWVNFSDILNYIIIYNYLCQFLTRIVTWRSNTFWVSSLLFRCISQILLHYFQSLWQKRYYHHGTWSILSQVIIFGPQEVRVKASQSHIIFHVHSVEYHSRYDLTLL